MIFPHNGVLLRNCKNCTIDTGNHIDESYCWIKPHQKKPPYFIITFNKYSSKYTLIYQDRKWINSCLGIGRLEEDRNNTSKLFWEWWIYMFFYSLWYGFTGVYIDIFLNLSDCKFYIWIFRYMDYMSYSY